MGFKQTISTSLCTHNMNTICPIKHWLKVQYWLRCLYYLCASLTSWVSQFACLFYARSTELQKHNIPLAWFLSLSDSRGVFIFIIMTNMLMANSPHCDTVYMKFFFEIIKATNMLLFINGGLLLCNKSKVCEFLSFGQKFCIPIKLITAQELCSISKLLSQRFFFKVNLSYAFDGFTFEHMIILISRMI